MVANIARPPFSKSLDPPLAFFIIFKGLSVKQIKQKFFEGESPTLKKLLLFIATVVHLRVLFLIRNTDYEVCSILPDTKI